MYLWPRTLDAYPWGSKCFKVQIFGLHSTYVKSMLTQGSNESCAVGQMRPKKVSVPPTDRNLTRKARGRCLLYSGNGGCVTQQPSQLSFTRKDPYCPCDNREAWLPCHCDLLEAKHLEGGPFPLQAEGRLFGLAVRQALSGPQSTHVFMGARLVPD